MLNYNPGQNILTKALFFCITQPASEKAFSPFSMLLPSGSLHRTLKNNTDDWGKRKFLFFFHNFCPGLQVLNTPLCSFFSIEIVRQSSLPFPLIQLNDLTLKAPINISTGKSPDREWCKWVRFIESTCVFHSNARLPAVKETDKRCQTRSVRGAVGCFSYVTIDTQEPGYRDAQHMLSNRNVYAIYISRFKKSLYFVI